MHPELARIAGVSLESYGVALSLGFAAGIAVAVRRGVARGLDARHVLDVSLVILVTSLLGARLLWVATNWELFQPPNGSWRDVFDPSRGDRFGIGGLSNLGGVVLAASAAWAMLAVRRLPVLAFLDLLAPSVALGEAITRIGCFLNGCCHGVPCALPWGVRFPPGSLPAQVFGGLALHPTQLYTTGAALGVFLALLHLDRRRLPPGSVFFAFLILSGALRIAIDVVRHYGAEALVLQTASLTLTQSQAISLGLVLVGSVGLLRRGPRPTQPRVERA